jgi:hypothetical protein
VQAAHDAASNGAIIVLPAGTDIWDTTVTITKAVTLQGNGVGSTIVQDGINGTSPILIITLAPALNTRMTAIEFEDNNPGASKDNGVIQLNGSNADSRRMRVDNCKFDILNGISLFTLDVLGVLKNCEFVVTTSIPLYIYHQNWNGVGYSAGSWADTIGFGSEEFLFIEDCTVTRASGVVYAMTDAYRGARYVVRNCEITNCWIEAHGTDSGGIYRGTRAVEAYDNNFYADGVANTFVVNMRSGTLVAHGNTTTGFTNPKFALGTYRARFPFPPFGSADGKSPFDVNVGGGPFLTETATGGTEGTVVVSGAGWDVNEWVGYSVVKTSTAESNPFDGQNSSIVYSNTSDTITYLDAGSFDFSDENKRMDFANGETFQLWKVNHAYDQPGRGQGTQLVVKQISSLTSSGTTVTVTCNSHGYTTGDWIGIQEVAIAVPTNTNYNGYFQVTVTGANTFTYTSWGSNLDPDVYPGSCVKVTWTAGANDQVTEPGYEWNNTQGGTNIGFSADGYTAQIRSGEHFFNDTAMPGYTPYTYPHPLTVEIGTTARVPGRSPAARKVMRR